MGEGKTQNCTREGRQTEMGTRIGGERGEGEDRGKTKGFTGCGKLESSALLKLPSHFFLV